MGYISGVIHNHEVAGSSPALATEKEAVTNIIFVAAFLFAYNLHINREEICKH